MESDRHVGAEVRSAAEWRIIPFQDTIACRFDAATVYTASFKSAARLISPEPGRLQVYCPGRLLPMHAREDEPVTTEIHARW